MLSFDPIKNNLNKKEMTLQEIYKKETGKNPVRKDMLDNYRPSMKYVEWLEAKINYTRCCNKLKTKKAPTFDHWLICNFEETKTGSYIDFNNGVTYRDKQVLKLKYNKIFKPTL